MTARIGNGEVIFFNSLPELSCDLEKKLALEKQRLAGEYEIIKQYYSELKFEYLKQQNDQMSWLKEIELKKNFLLHCLNQPKLFESTEQLQTEVASLDEMAGKIQRRINLLKTQEEDVSQGLEKLSAKIISLNGVTKGE